jgi:hypothetical protein
MQHLERHILPARAALESAYPHLPQAIADDIKAKVDNLIDRIEAYQSAVDLLLTAIVQEGVRPDYTPEFKALAESANLLRRQPVNSIPFNGSGPVIPGFYWCVHKETGKVTVGELVKETDGFCFHFPVANTLSSRSFNQYFWVGPLRNHPPKPS